MKDDFYNFFDGFCFDYDYEFRSYSGRGMFGKQCVGIVIPNNIGKAILDIGIKLGEMDESDVKNYSYVEFVESFHKILWDNMGLEYIIYFPDIEYDTSW